MSKVNLKSELNRIVKQYGLKEVQTWERFRDIECPENGATCEDEDCMCGGTGTYEIRGEWTNASRVWVGKASGKSIVVVSFDDGWPFFAVTVAKGWKFGTTIEAQKALDRLSESTSATTSHWDGDVAGSAIKRHPDSLRGFMYRTVVEGHDGHILPPDIVKYLLAQ